VALDVIAFSRPANALSRLAGPLARRVQDRITDRYVTAAHARHVMCLSCSASSCASSSVKPTKQQ
jgi:uncharacterized protein DUF1990